MSKKSLQKTSGFSIWLLPDNRTGSIFNNIIGQLSGIFPAPVFTPHITLSGTPEGTEQNRLQSVIDNLSKDRYAFSVHTNELICGTPPFQRYFLQLEPAEELYSLGTECNELLNGSYARRDNFHISLIYGFTDCNSIKRVCKEKEATIPSKVYVQKIALTDIGGLPGEWDIIYSRNLLT